MKYNLNYQKVPPKYMINSNIFIEIILLMVYLYSNPVFIIHKNCYHLIWKPSPVLIVENLITVIAS